MVLIGSLNLTGITVMLEDRNNRDNDFFFLMPTNSPPGTLMWLFSANKRRNRLQLRLQSGGNSLLSRTLSKYCLIRSFNFNVRNQLGTKFRISTAEHPFTIDRTLSWATSSAVKCWLWPLSSSLDTCFWATRGGLWPRSMFPPRRILIGGSLIWLMLTCGQMWLVIQSLINEMNLMRNIRLWNAKN